MPALIQPSTLCRRPICAVLLVLLSCCATGNAAPTDIPSLNWTPRSDWVNVKSAVFPRAVGDGQADDTAAIQKALDGVKDGSTVYFPPGTYRITKTLTLRGPLHGVLLVGHGRDTGLIWDGPAGGSLFLDDGVAYSRFVGLSFDGKGKAAVGFLHAPDRRFETEVRHQHLAFRNFTDAGILVDPKTKTVLAETTFENCLFEDCRRGVVFTQFNDYDYTFDGCEFRRSETAIECRHANVYVRNCHFEDSRVVDILAEPEHASSIRRCSSNGSNAFIQYASGVSPMTIQDCRVANWKSPRGAIQLAGAPIILFDSVFTDGPANTAPVQIGRNGQRLIVSENSAPGAPAVVVPSPNFKLYSVPAGRRKGSLTSADQTFLVDSLALPKKIFDAKRDFGAKGDAAADDTAAIQKTIDAARTYGKGALAYLPNGKYVVKDTLRITGKDYLVGGGGWATRLLWKGAEGGTTIEIRDPQDITLEHITVGADDVSGANAIDIHQIGGRQPSRMIYDEVYGFGIYQKQPLRKGFRFTNLGENAVVIMPHVQGNMHFSDCAQATILANCSYEGSVIVDGKDPRRSGLLGFLTRLTTIVTHSLYLRDNQNIVMSDLYIEQSENGFVFEGAQGLPAGRATIQGAKIQFSPVRNKETGTFLTINDYAGEIFFGHNQFYTAPHEMKIRHQGLQPLDLFVLACSFYDVKLDIQKSDAATIAFIGNDTFGMKNVQFSAGDVLSENAVSRLAPMLDDLRRLGQADLSLNHGGGNSRPEDAKP